MCSGSRSSDEDAVAYAANSEELAYQVNLSKIKYRVPKNIADQANAAYASHHSRSSKTCATPSNTKAYAAAPPSAPSHGNLQSRLNALASDAASQDYGL
jgi:hypothetical protein